MPLLLNAYKQVGHEFGFDIAQVLLTLGDFEDHRRFLNTRNTVHRLLESNVVPIVNENDTITTEEIRVGDNDRLAAKVAQMVGADDFVILTGVDGLYDRNPDEPGAKFIAEVEDVGMYMDATKGKSTLGTGRMETKLLARTWRRKRGSPHGSPKARSTTRYRACSTVRVVRPRSCRIPTRCRAGTAGSPTACRWRGAS